MSEFADARARERISGELKTTFFVEAAAGTGKTTELIRRLVGLVRSGAGTLAQIVAVTFTEKSAGEMKLRLRSEIESARASAQGNERERLDDALRQLELARIGTIHAFCMDILHERPLEARIDPLFEIRAEDEADTIADEAFDNWFQRMLSDPPEGVRRVLRRKSKRHPPREQLRTALQTLRKHRDFPTPWRRDAFDRNAQIDKLMADLADVGALAALSSSG
jgi:ATP-dependent exoDNAse (exonuclease V) beta subunit